jgi:hypothetical protein
MKTIGGLATWVMLMATTHASTFSTLPLTGDGDSGISASSAFTLAIDVIGTPNTTANGAVFTGSANNGITNPATNNYSTTGLPNWIAPGPGQPNNVTGNVGAMLNDFNYNGATPTETLTLNNLRVGERYITTFYNRSWQQGDRTNNITTSDGGAISFNQDASATGTGSMLKYDFVAQSNSLTFTFTETIPNASFHQYAFSNEIPKYQALLTDNYYAPSNPNTGDVNFNLAARQGGLYATTTYTPVGNQQVGNNTGGIDSGNYLLSAFGGTTALDRNWKNALSGGGQLIAFDMAPNVGGGDSSFWAGISLGLSEANKNSSINGNVPHFGILFRGNGLIQAWDGNAVVSGSEEWISTPANVTTQLHRIELLLSDSGDGNPFDGVGETKIDVFADGLFVYSFTKTGGGYADNFINFSGTNIGGFDNLLIARVPEPASFILLAMGLLTLGLFRRKR